MKNLSLKTNELRDLSRSLQLSHQHISSSKSPLVETKSKRKEKVDVTRGKGIKLLSEVALTGEAQIKEGNDEDDSNDENDLENKFKDEENKSDDDQTTSDSEKVKDDDEDDDNDEDKSEGDEDRGMDSDDVQDKKADVERTYAQQEKENLKITQ
nr:hypothetical protein [Tanacetum cinerariifolium]